MKSRKKSVYETQTDRPTDRDRGAVFLEHTHTHTLQPMMAAVSMAPFIITIHESYSPYHCAPRAALVVLMSTDLIQRARE